LNRKNIKEKKILIKIKLLLSLHTFLKLGTVAEWLGGPDSYRGQNLRQRLPVG
jgi:hypothetical protein